jgi:7-cyano-7-deazaguanine reductase
VGYRQGGEGKETEDKYASRRFDLQGPEAIAREVLEALPYAYPGRRTEVTYVTEEFTSVCPWTGLPDFGRLEISYVPKEKLVELKSLKYYLTSFRQVGILQEHAVNVILDDLVRLLDPVEMTVRAVFRERGGISTQAVARYPQPT